MKKASPYAFLQKRNRASRPEQERAEQDLLQMPPPPPPPHPQSASGPFSFLSSIFRSSEASMPAAMPPPPPPPPEHQQKDLNVFVVTFDGMKECEKNLAGGDPYHCKRCSAVLNQYSKVTKESTGAIMLMENESLWCCQFCGYPNVLSIEKEEIPTKDDVFYLLESEYESHASASETTMVFCIDTSGSMNTTTEVTGKIDLKFGLSNEEIEMLRQFMEPGDDAQFNFLPGAHNKNKTFISRKQCVLSAVESALSQLRKTDPLRKVGLVTFNNEVTVIVDSKGTEVSILGDRLGNQEGVLGALGTHKIGESLGEGYEGLITRLGRVEAKGQTALGPALLAAIELASRGGPGSSVTLCTDGLANIGLGALEFGGEAEEKFYSTLAEIASSKNVMVNIITIKGQASKMSVLSKIAELTNGNVKVVNPEKIADDFANVLKDEVVGLNVQAKIMLHRAMMFRNEPQQNLKADKTIMERILANATVHTKISFEYEVRCLEDLEFMEIDIDKLKSVPFQSQIVFMTPKGARYLRVITSESKTTTEHTELKKEAYLPVVHHRIATNAAKMCSRGDYKGSMAQAEQWNTFINREFTSESHQMQQRTFQSKNERLIKAVEHKQKKKRKKDKEKDKAEKPKISPKISEESDEDERQRRSRIDSDEDEVELMDNLMEKRSWHDDID